MSSWAGTLPQGQAASRLPPEHPLVFFFQGNRVSYKAQETCTFCLFTCLSSVHACISRLPGNTYTEAEVSGSCYAQEFIKSGGSRWPDRAEVPQ